MSEHIEVLIDDLAVEVDAEDYKNNPEGVVASVRRARASLGLPADGSEESHTDFDILGDCEDEGVQEEAYSTPAGDAGDDEEADA